MKRALGKLPEPIKKALKGVALALLKTRERWTGEAPDAVLLLAHMRSGSTLLMHILLSHPAILGYGERNRPYASARDMDRLTVDACYQRRQFFRSPRYVVDQINHTRFLASEALLNHPRVRTIFLIREPEDSIASMVEVLGRYYGMTLDEAVAYYSERLQALARYAQGIENPARTFFLTYDDLVTETTSSLHGLQAFLSLETALSEDYRRFDFTGRRGDPSTAIESGSILKDKPRRRIELAPEILARTRAAYDDCRAVLAARCESIKTFKRGLTQPPRNVSS